MCPQDALELQREVELLVGAYAGLYGNEQSTVTAPSMARAAAAVEEQRLALRRARRQQVLKVGGRGEGVPRTR